MKDNFLDKLMIDFKKFYDKFNEFNIDLVLSSNDNYLKHSISSELINNNISKYIYFNQLNIKKKIILNKDKLLDNFINRKISFIKNLRKLDQLIDKDGHLYSSLTSNNLLNLIYDLQSKIFISDHLFVIDNINKIITWNVEHDILLLSQTKTKNKPKIILHYITSYQWFESYILLKNFIILNIINYLISLNYICCIQEGSYLLLWLIYQYLDKKLVSISYIARPWHNTIQDTLFFNNFKEDKYSKVKKFITNKSVDARCIFLLTITIIPRKKYHILKKVTMISASIYKNNMKPTITNNNNNTCNNLLENIKLNHISIKRGLIVRCIEKNIIQKPDEMQYIKIINVHVKVIKKNAHLKFTHDEELLIRSLIKKYHNKTTYLLGDFNSSCILIQRYLKHLLKNHKINSNFINIPQLETAVDGIYKITKI